MSPVRVDLSDALRHRLTSLAKDLYWSDLAYQEAAVRVREMAEAAGLGFVDDGYNRLVLKIPPSMVGGFDDPLAVKLPRHRRGPDGMKQNIHEIDLYEYAPAWLREYLVPIEAAHPDGYWLVMRYAPAPESSEIEERRQSLLDRGIPGNEIHSEDNWGAGEKRCT